MSQHSTLSDRKEYFLRRHAEEILKTGSAPGGRTPLDAEALTLLCRMAGDPDRSSDALRLLQELQVHQVEVELQRAQLESNEREMSRELSQYRSLFELTPTASLMVTREGRIIEANPAAAALLDTGQDELTGRELLEFLKPEVRVSWSEMLRNLNDGEPSVHCNVPAVDGADQAFTLRLSAKVSPEGDAVLLTFASGEPVLHDLRILQRSR